MHILQKTETGSFNPCTINLKITFTNILGLIFIHGFITIGAWGGLHNPTKL